MQFKSLLVIGSMAVMGLSFSSCSEDVTFDGNAAFEQQKAQYEANFIKKFGPVDPKQTWDFSTMTPVYGLPASGSSVATRAASGSVTRGQLPNKLVVDQTFIEWMHTNMKAGVNNCKKGNPFYLTASGKDFTIVPIFQGQATYYWELYMHVYDENGENGEDIQVWKKGQELEQMETSTSNWTACGPTDKIADNAYAVRSPQFSFSVPKNRNYYFYLLTWDTYDKFTSNKPHMSAIPSSLNSHMLSLEGFSKPSFVPEGNEAMIIGCEDKLKSSDNDFEDLVFMMYSEELPETNFKEIEVRKTKRYLIEDLGSIDDFDFNDIVADMSIVWKEKVTLKYDANGGWVEDESIEHQEIPGSRHQEAIVRALGGTINIRLLVGNTEIWQKEGNYPITNMLNTGWGGTEINYNAVYAKISNKNADGQDLWTWIPDENNISVIVEYPEGGTNNSFGVQIISFQKEEGKVPVIIAVDPTINEGWRSERDPIDPSWWY